MDAGAHDVGSSTGLAILPRVVMGVVERIDEQVVELSAAPPAVGEARRRVLEAAQPFVDEGRLADLQLVVSEVASNAVRHGGHSGTILLQVTPKEGYLCVRVTDSGNGLAPTPRATAPDEDGGWGFFLIERFTRRWGLTREDRRTRVWFEFDFEGDAVDNRGPGRHNAVMRASIRASDADREEVAEVLRDRAGEGYLSVETLAERLDRAYAAREAGELAPLIADLPSRYGRVHSTLHRLGAAARETLRTAAREHDRSASVFTPDPTAQGGLGRGRFTLGRAPGCEHRFDDPSVSRHHAELRHLDGRWILTDLRSTNGLFVNGRRVWRVAIEAGDRLELGGLALVFEPLPSATGG